MQNTYKLKFVSWLLVVFVVVLAVVVWAGERLGGGKLTTYDVFPLLGLCAFSIMWTHYIAGSVRRHLKVEIKENKTYLKITSQIVLALILLHPGLLIIQLNKDGFGLPPNSYIEVYSGAGMKLALLFGTISLIIFLTYELRKMFYKKTWWRFVNWAQILAMFLIFYHGLTLGRELSVEWFKIVWYFYGLSLVAAIFYNSWYDKRVRLNKET